MAKPSRTLLYTANADSINAFFGTDASKLLMDIYNNDSRLTARRTVRNNDPENELDGELFIVVDDNNYADADLTLEIGNTLIERVAAERARVRYTAEITTATDRVHGGVARVTWGNDTANSVTVRLNDDGGLDCDGALDWNAITDDDGVEVAEWLAVGDVGDTFDWLAPAV